MADDKNAEWIARIAPLMELRECVRLNTLCSVRPCRWFLPDAIYKYGSRAMGKNWSDLFLHFEGV